MTLLVGHALLVILLVFPLLLITGCRSAKQVPGQASGSVQAGPTLPMKVTRQGVVIGPIHSSGRAADAFWNPLGTRLALLENNVLWSLNPAEGKLMRLLAPFEDQEINGDLSNQVKVLAHDIPASDGMHWVTWSPDGTRAVYPRLAGNGRARVNIMDITSGKEVATDVTTPFLDHSAWSPDSRLLAVKVGVDGRHERADHVDDSTLLATYVQVLDATGGLVARFEVPGKFLTGLRWLDGERLAFVEGRKGPPDPYGNGDTVVQGRAWVGEVGKGVREPTPAESAALRRPPPEREFPLPRGRGSGFEARVTSRQPVVPGPLEDYVYVDRVGPQ